VTAGGRRPGGGLSAGRGSLLLVGLFLALLGWYLLYTEQIIRSLRADAATLTQMFAQVQIGLSDPDPGAPERALVRLQEILLESGVPLVLAGEGDRITAAVNLPFEVDLGTEEGQRRVRAYAARLSQRNPSVGDPEVALVYFGDPPELARLRWIPWLQVVGLFLTFLVGTMVVRAQRRSEADRAWTSMARELAHQLGTPISSLQGWLEVLRLPRFERPATLGEAEIASEIEADVERLERVSRRFELIGREPPLGEIDLLEVVRGVERYIQARLPRLGQGVRMQVVQVGGVPRVRGNDVLIAWALENLLKNSLDALAGRGGRIQIQVGPVEAQGVVVRVQDDGPGVDPGIRDRLFEPGVTLKSGGWGVGLSLAKRIVERIHGGRLDLVETGPAGTIFQLWLPQV